MGNLPTQSVGTWCVCLSTAFKKCFKTIKTLTKDIFSLSEFGENFSVGGVGHIEGGLNLRGIGTQENVDLFFLEWPVK